MKRIGFTLVEMTTVVGIISMLLLIVMPMVLNRQQKFAERVSQTDLATLRGAIFAYQRDTSLTPNSLTDLWSTTCPSTGVDNNGVTQSVDSSRWRGPYVDPQFAGVANELLTSGSVNFVKATAGSPCKVSDAAVGTDSDGVSYGTY